MTEQERRSLFDSIHQQLDRYGFTADSEPPFHKLTRAEIVAIRKSLIRKQKFFTDNFAEDLTSNSLALEMSVFDSDN